MPDEAPVGRSSAPPPWPDPSFQTTEALRRDLTALRDELHAEMEGDRKLLASQFKHVDGRFSVIESQRIEQKKDTKDAVDAALTAQKEANGKSELSTKEQLKALADTFGTSIQGIGKQIDDVKDRVVETNSRLDQGQGQITGATEYRTDSRASSMALGQMAAWILAAAMSATAILIAVLK